MVAMFFAIIGMIDRFFNFGNYHWSLRRAFWICCDLCRFITFRLAAWRFYKLQTPIEPNHGGAIWPWNCPLMSPLGFTIRAGCKPIWEVRRLTSQWTSRPPDCCGALICLGQTSLAALRCGTARRCPTDTPSFQTKGTVRAKLVEAGRATP